MKKIKRIQTIMVDEDVVKDIQDKDMDFYVSNLVITNILTMHEKDEDVKILYSPVFKEYQKNAAKQKKDFEIAKNNMINKYVPEDIAKFVTEWSLNYFTNELFLTIQK